MKNYFPQRGSASKKYRESSQEYLPAFTCRWRRTCSIRCLRLPAFGHCFSSTVCLILARRSRNAYWFCKFLLGKLCQATGQWKEKGNRKGLRRDEHELSTVNDFSCLIDVAKTYQEFHFVPVPSLVFASTNCT